VRGFQHSLLAWSDDDHEASCRLGVEVESRTQGVNMKCVRSGQDFALGTHIFGLIGEEA